MSLLASSTELPTLTTIALVVRFAGLQSTTWDRLGTALGTPPDLRILSMMPAEVLQKAIHDLRIPVTTAPTDGSPQPTREPNATEAIQMALVWRVARQVMGLPDVDPLVINATSTSTHSPVLASGSGGLGGTSGTATPTGPPSKKVKISTVLDQTDETEVTLKSRAELVKYFENHREITGSEPMPEVEPTDIQVAAMEEKVVVRDEAPYADFSILTPFGRRMQKTMKMKSFAFQPDGTWKTAEIPGPPNLQAWQACFNRAVLYMLRYPVGTSTTPPTKGGPVGVVTREPVVIQPHLLELYFEAFMELCLEYPECWHLLMPAEDRMRGERFEHLRRSLARAHAAGKVPVDVEYDPARPWDGVFQAAARDHLYWDSNVRRPAVSFLARARNTPQPALEPMSEGAKASIRNIESAMGAASSQPDAAVKKRKKRKRAKDGKGGSGDTDSKEEKEVAVNKKLVDKQNNRDHPKKWGGMFHTTQEGKPVCYAFAKGSSPDACPGNCKNGRARQVHVLFGKPPEQGLPEEARKGWRKRRKEVGTRPRWGRRACRQRRGRGFEPRRSEPSEVQIPRTLCGLWRLHWGSQDRMWRQGDCARCAGSMDDRVGHHGRRTFRGVEEVGQRGRPYPSCAAMQVNDEGKTSGRAWISSNDSVRETTYGLGASFGGRRKPHCRANIYFVRLCTREWWNLFSGKPLGQLLVVASSDEAPHGKRHQGRSASVCIWMRKQEGNRDPYNLTIGKESLSEMWGHTPSRTRCSGRQRLELRLRPTTVGLENINGCRISCRALLGLGQRAELLLGGGGNSEGSVGSKLCKKRRERNRKKQEDGSCTPQWGLAGAERVGKPAGLGWPEKSISSSGTYTCNVGCWPSYEGGSFESTEKKLRQASSREGGGLVWAMQWPGPQCWSRRLSRSWHWRLGPMQRKKQSHTDQN